MKFSIVTPTLNAAAHIEALLASIAAQHHQDWEHIVVDGGSTDATLNVVKARAERDTRVRLIEASGSSIYQAIFVGLDCCQGEMLSWLNGDDCYTPWALTSVDRFATSRPVDWVTGFPAAWDGDGRLRLVRPFGLWPRGLIRRGLFHNDLLGFIQAESVFFTAALFRRLAPAQREKVLAARLAGDFLLWRAFAEYAPLLVIPTVLGGFRLHGRNRSLTEHDSYMAEVYGSGAWRAPPWLGRRVGRAFQLVSTLSGFSAMMRADVELQGELGQAER